jgi:hypothetical protein
MLWQTAVNAGKKITGMESFSSQIDIVRRIPLKSHVAGLVRFLKYHHRAQRQTDNLLKMYAAGNIQELARIARKSLRENRQILSDERNIQDGSEIRRAVVKPASVLRRGRGSPGRQHRIAAFAETKRDVRETRREKSGTVSAIVLILTLIYSFFLFTRFCYPFILSSFSRIFCC